MPKRNPRRTDKFLFMSMEILPVIMNLIIKASKKRSQIHPGRCYERSKKNRDRKHIHTRKSVLYPNAQFD